jgi:hypothetical protein
LQLELQLEEVLEIIELLDKDKDEIEEVKQADDLPQ